MAEGEKNALAGVVQSLTDIPTTAKPSLVRALSYLLGGFGNYLGAWLRRPVQAVEDRTDARTLITRAVALAAADKLAHDPDVIAAAMAQWGPADLNRHANKMKIARETIIELSAVADDDGTERADQTQTEIDDDFLNSFERFCSDSSDEKMQRLWARLLAGEIRRPGSYSRRTLRALYDMDSRTADQFTRVSAGALRDMIIVDSDERPEALETAIELEAAGLLSGAGGILHYTLRANDRGVALLAGNRLGLAVAVASGATIPLEALPLSPVGKELLTLLPPPDEESTLRSIAEHLKAKGAEGASLITVVRRDGAGVTYRVKEHLWGEEACKRQSPEQAASV
jgi:hypothetical protein